MNARTRNHRSRLPVEAPWLIYLVAVAALSFAERLVTPEARGADLVLDKTILIVAGLGVFVAWAFSMKLARQSRTRYPALLTARLAVECFLGPPLGLVTVTAIAWDVDGGRALFVLPLIGFILPLITLPRMMTKLRRINRGEVENNSLDEVRRRQFFV